jgi:glyoxylase-like metal-dependent hydrolase (beta-lactamase superfamily II)
MNPRIRNIGVAMLAAGAFVGAATLASAPAVKTQAPGYYRMALGDFEVTALNDGTFDMPWDQLLTNATPADMEKALKANFLSMPVESSVNGFLVNTGAKLVLIDAGSGTMFVPTTGKLIANLKAAGYQPEQVDEIYITHFHADHVGGLVTGDQRAFPNAVVRADKSEADYWLSKEKMNAAPEGARGSFQKAQAALGPYVSAGKFQPFTGDTDLVPGVKAISARGHTPGHTIYAIESKGQKLVLWGDLMHAAAMQFPDPSVAIKFDTDSVAAAAQRKKAYADAAAGGYWIGAAHLPFPALGHLKTASPGYAYVPANYTTKAN